MATSGEMNPVLMQEIMGVMNVNNIVQNVLGIPVIEIEQLNPRIRNVNGIMKVKYNSIGADIKDPEGTLTYEYDWVGGILEFISNPYPRVPVGTGKVAFLADDENDPMGKGLPLPASSKSGYTTGWNREFLASHYGEAYWRIINPKIDEEIRERYRNILVNIGIDQEEVGKRVEEATKKQLMGSSGTQRITISRTSGPVIREKLVKQSPTAGEIENHPLVEGLMKRNKELEEMVKGLATQKRDGEINEAIKEFKTEEKSGLCSATGKDGTPCRALAKQGSKYCVHHLRIIEKKESVMEPEGNMEK